MVFVLAWTIGDVNSSLSCQSLHQSHFLYTRISSDIVTWCSLLCQSLHQSHFLYSRISCDIVTWCSLLCQSLHQSHFLYSRISSDIVTWSKRTGVVPLQRWPWSFPWVFFSSPLPFVAFRLGGYLTFVHTNFFWRTEWLMRLIELIIRFYTLSFATRTTVSLRIWDMAVVATLCLRWHIKWFKTKTLGEPVVILVVWCNSESSNFFLVASKCYKYTITTLSQGLRVEILHFLVKNSH